VKIAFLGPSHSGKSCLSYGVRQLLAATSGLPRPFLIDTTPDGEGSWFQTTYRRFPETAERLKSKKQRPFDWPWALHAASSVEKCRLPLVLVDTGGKLDAKLAVICRRVTHVVLVAPEGADCQDWLAFIDGMAWELLVIVRSSMTESADSIAPAAGTKPPELIVHGLLRGNDVRASPAVKWIVKEIARRLSRRAVRRRSTPLVPDQLGGSPDKPLVESVVPASGD